MTWRRQVTTCLYHSVTASFSTASRRKARRAIARELVGLSFEQAAKVVRAHASKQEPPQGRQKPRHVADTELAALNGALRSINELEDVALARTLNALDVDARRKLDGDISRAIRKLTAARRFGVVR